MKKTNLVLLLLYSLSIIFTSCGKDDPDIPNEEELITTVIYTLIPGGGGSNVVMSFRDLDGDGGNAPIIEGGTFEANTNYNGTIELLNESESPVEDITTEIRSEAEEHQFFFQSGISDFRIGYNDQDANGDPIGINTVLSTGAATSGTLKITLRHEPDKNGSGVSEGDISNAGGETDIEVIFPVNVQ